MQLFYSIRRRFLIHGKTNSSVRYGYSTPSQLSVPEETIFFNATFEKLHADVA
jgi:hypothetical protein